LLLRKAFFSILLSFLITGLPLLSLKIQPVKALETGIIYINADGSINPLTDLISTVDNVTYTLASSILNGSVVILRDSIVLDGIGNALRGLGREVGIDLHGVANVTVENVQITGFGVGVQVNSSSNDLVSDLDIDGCGEGIFLSQSNHNTISENNVTKTSGSGNGIELGSCSNNTISFNNVTGNGGRGIFLDSSNNNIVFANEVAQNTQNGVDLDFQSDCNVISRNNITDNYWYGINLDYHSNNNTISENNFVSNYVGIGIQEDSSGNMIYHNNFIHGFYVNLNQVQSYGFSSNVWDNGYPSGGNYWSDYLIQYPNAVEIDNSSIWNTPYTVSDNDIDHYPLMQTWPMPFTNTVLKVITQDMNGQTISGMNVTVIYGAGSQTQTTGEGETTFWLGHYNGTISLNITATSAFEKWLRNTTITTGNTVFYVTLQEAPQSSAFLQLLQQYAWAIIIVIGVGIILVAVVYAKKRRV